MEFLVDTHLLLWSTFEPSRLSVSARTALEDPTNLPYFSTASLWEVTVKRSQGKDGFQVDPRHLQEGLLRIGYRQLEIYSSHVISVGSLPLIHRDPFDRLLMAQAAVEGFVLLTSDRKISQYPGQIQKV